MASDSRVSIDRVLSLVQLIYDFRADAGLGQRELAARSDTAQSVIWQIGEGGGFTVRLDALAGVAAGLDRHVVLLFPTEVPDQLDDSVQVI